ncbi:MAG: hypothetical protein NT051_05360 [Candidatus Micrarchaeota archaeon]|nr:hypothetical protein [Candidatus Micrarchaeota archaeon]
MTFREKIIRIKEYTKGAFFHSSKNLVLTDKMAQKVEAAIFSLDLKGIINKERCLTGYGVRYTHVGKLSNLLKEKDISSEKVASFLKRIGIDGYSDAMLNVAELPNKKAPMFPAHAFAILDQELIIKSRGSTYALTECDEIYTPDKKQEGKPIVVGANHFFKLNGAAAQDSSKISWPMIVVYLT